MPFKKVLWVVNYDKISEFVSAAKATGATDVAIRSDNDVERALEEFAKKGIGVYSWRWPSAKRDPAMKEAAKIVKLFGKGLKGYYVDPEGEPGASYDWDQNGLEKLATDFCNEIKSAPNSYLGVTSHYRAKKTHPKLPWREFFQKADILLPQSYWRTSKGPIGHGDPEDNYDRGIQFWKSAGGNPDLIVPMAGEIASVTAAEIGKHVAAATKNGRTELHFYTYTPKVSKAVIAKIASL